MKMSSALGGFLLLSVTTLVYVTQTQTPKARVDIETKLTLTNVDYGWHQLSCGEKRDISLPESDVATYLSVSCREMAEDSVELVANVERHHRTSTGNYNMFTSPSLTLTKGSDGSIESGDDKYVDLYWWAKSLR